MAHNVAMVGAGQLARMTYQAAINLGINLRVLADDKGAPAVKAGAEWILGSPDSIESLRSLATGSSVVTFDHERIPTEHLQTLEDEGFRLAPSCVAVRLAQDKLACRRELLASGFPVPTFTDLSTPDKLAPFAAEHGWPLVAKAQRGGYDGRGVWMLSGPEDLERLLEHNSAGLLIEPQLEIAHELAVLVARNEQGQSVCYEPVETIQREAMCREILAPATVDAQIVAEAKELALSIANQIQSTGVMAVELFVTAKGLVVNELALRPHNSGHYTIEGCETSQFEQHLRAILNLPLGRPTLLFPAVATVNVVGGLTGVDPRGKLEQALAVAGAHVHLYEKQSRPRRKLGHVTVCGQDRASTIQTALRAASRLEGESR